MEGMNYMEPKREILSPIDMPRWLKSQAYHEFLGFIMALNNAVKEKTMQSDYIKSEKCEKVVQLLEILDKWIDECPAVDQPVRFGNTAYRDWFTKLETESETLLKDLLPSDQSGAILELQAYFKDGFGNKTRIDYGSGHEASFTAFLCCLYKLNVLQESDYTATVFHIFKRYLDLMRRLQKVYRMEPAGSHGVWGLDDFNFLPFFWGSAQLSDNNYALRPNSIPEQKVCNANKNEYLFFDCINNIHEVKTGPFFEHSNTLWGISSVQTWSKVNSGLLKMYKAEVLSKFPVMQHFVFGSILSIEPVPT
ncbi:serine/threonine-protein phosphatase 2A activator-like [Dendronephthya gigantea]|uniref:serine/threonine-protein phosphatase 2A activator-like n=1 Tax=Dendronephthya gigantea TaxID=151771 RepID=UPI00106CBE55|nr:serine/threonine-protein phosphatase 2A activator-like [Dendronephthya gigantea]